MVNSKFRTRDFIRTAEQLYFAIVSDHLIDGRLFCCLRYVRQGDQYRKLSTSEANELLSKRFPQYQLDSAQFVTPVHAVPLASVQRHYHPRQRVDALLGASSTKDRVEETARQVVNWLIEQGILASELGITGSLLINAHHDASDIDVVVYNRQLYRLARQSIQLATARGALSQLTAALWQDAYARRGCSLSYNDFLWHEQRKHNKFSWNGQKVDISLCAEDPPCVSNSARKLRLVDVTAQVVRDDFSFDHPAVWEINCPAAKRLVSWTPTYSGQARRGEIIRVRGWLEETDDGQRQIVVGSSRESAGELVRVVT